MSPKSKTTSAVLEEADETIKPVKNIKEIKEKAQIMEQSIIDEDNDEEIEISSQKYITVISLCPNELNLSTVQGGKGKTFTFQKFGETKSIMYQYLVDIMDATPRFLNEGYYYIADKKVIRRHGLNLIYDTLLKKKVIEDIFNGTLTNDEIGSLYKSANPSQQSVVRDLIIQKLMTDENSVDMNTVATISKISHIDILKQVEDNKFYSKKPDA
jgi:hypothetical protein